MICHIVWQARRGLAAWLDPGMAETNETNLDLIGELNALVQILRDDNNHLNARWAADLMEHRIFVADHGRCLHPSREEENP